MINCWELPESYKIGETVYGLNTDYRDVLEIFTYLDDPDLPEFIKWKIAVALFYQEEIPDENFQAAAEYLAFFIRCGQKETKGPRMLDWQQDAIAIVADVNRVAGTEIRCLKKLHWWTFMSWFHGIGQGQLSAILTIREKLRKGRKLESWEQDFYRENKKRVDLPPRYSIQEREEQERLQRLLDDTKVVNK